MIFLLLLGFISDGAPILLGRQEASFAFKGSEQLVLPNYQNNGFVQKANKDESGWVIEVKVNNAPLKSNLPAVKCQLPNELEDLQEVLNAPRNKVLADQIVALISWMRTDMIYRENAASQKLQDVITRLSGDCVGYSNFFQYICAELGLKTRFATGLAFRKHESTTLKLEGNVLHRWVEVYYEDVGWVFCDPSGKVHHVEATYFLLGIEGVDPLETILKVAEGSTAELLNFQNGFWMALKRKDLHPGLRIRAN